MGRANWRLTPSWVTKMMVQMAPNSPQSMFQIENDLSGKDFSLSLKALNPSMLDGGTTGIFITHYLQSLTPRLSLGVEMLWQRQSMAVGPDSMVSYSGRYRGSDWIATAQLQGQGAVMTSYWRRLTDKVDVGADLNLQFAGISGAGGESLLSRVQKDGQATLGAKYSFAQSIFRAQVDSGGALAVLLEKQVLPPVKVTFSGELDHVKVSSQGLADPKF